MRSSVVGVAASVGRSGAAVKRDKASSSPLSPLSSPAFPHSASYKVKEGDGERERAGQEMTATILFPLYACCTCRRRRTDGRTEWMER